jgi:hypothetical protein
MFRKIKLIALVSMAICILLICHEVHAGSTVYVCSEVDCSFTFTLGNCDPPPLTDSATPAYCGSKTLNCNTIQFLNVPSGTHYFSISGCGAFDDGYITVDGVNSRGLLLCPSTASWCCTNGCGQYGEHLCSECLASQPPSATTENATSVTSTKATLNASVNPNGSSTTYYFQYGKTTSYGSTTSPGSAGSGTSPVSVSSNLVNLNPETTYHFRIVATNAAGTDYGQDKVFTTGAILPATIMGTVTNAMTAQPIEGADVTTDGGGQTWTLSDGTYILLHPSGQWTLTASADGYEEKSSGATQFMEGAQVTIDFHLHPTPSTEMIYVNQYDATCNGHLPCYASIQEAVDASFPGAVIMVTTGRYDEDLIVNTSIPMTLQGGWNDTYTARLSNTEVNTLAIGSEGGPLTVDGINLKE